MPTIRLQDDPDRSLQWLVWDEQPQLALQTGDATGLALVLTWQVNAGRLSCADAAALLGVTPRTVQERCATYATTANSADLVDRRHFNPGQQTAYRMAAHRPALVAQWVRNLVADQPTSGRRLAAQLGGAVDDRTVDRHLTELGLRAAEATGLRAELQALVAQREQTAYQAGIAQAPLAGTGAPPLAAAGWTQQVSAQATAALGTAHLARNGAYASLQALIGERTGDWALWHALLTLLLVTGGAPLNWLRHLDWATLVGLLGGRVGPSLSHLRAWLTATTARARQTIPIRRSTGQVETLTRLQDYQEQAVAERVQRGLGQALAIRLDCYVNAVFRKENVTRAWHGTRHWAFKAFRRNVAQDAATGLPVTAPLSASDVKPLVVLQQVRAIINGGLDRVRPGVQLRLVIADRWWSVRAVIHAAGQDGFQLLCWARSVKSTVTALAALAEDDPRWQPISQGSPDPPSGPAGTAGVGYRLETELPIYGLEPAVRVIVDWDGQPGSPKRARLAVGLPASELSAAAASAQLRDRQHIEILLKLLLRRLDWSHFGGGPARIEPADAPPLTAEARQRIEKHRQQVRTRQRHAQETLTAVAAELAQLTAPEHPAQTGVLGLRQRDLQSLVKRLAGQVQRAATTLAHLAARLGEGSPPPPVPAPRAELDLTQESLLTQLKLDVFTAQETLVQEFIAVGLQPVLRAEATRQATARQQADKRSQSQQHPGEPLCRDAECLFQIKVANLEHETIRKSLLTQGGRLLWHTEKRLLLSVAHRFADRRLQAAYERYCVFLNQLLIQVPMDDGPPWRLLFTYEEPGADARFK
ncbi:MAG: hypothetical protein Q7T33_12885 [Dehalococcoidia bacterium]|nr:hypothetical protein [Dehalococcoidia bacterium]